MREHYFFRFGSENKLFTDNFVIKGNKLVSKKSNRPVTYINLAIHYSTFDAETLEKCRFSKDYSSIEKDNPKLHSNSINNIRTFTEAKAGSIFWIFHENMILPFEIYSEKIVGNKTLDIQEKKRLLPAKCKGAKFLGKVFQRHEVPELFATTDTAVIMGSIARFKDRPDMNENGFIADALLDGKSVLQCDEQVQTLKYLSPVQLETFFFLLFNDSKFVVSAYRGASKYKVDLVVKNNKPQSIGGFNFDQHLSIQVKRVTKPETVNKHLEKDIWFVTLSNDLEMIHPALIDYHKLKELLKLPEYASALRWAEGVLQTSKLEINYKRITSQAA